jgi:hypothetical protein
MIPNIVNTCCPTLNTVATRISEKMIKVRCSTRSGGEGGGCGVVLRLIFSHKWFVDTKGVIKSRKGKKELCTKEKVQTMIYKTLQSKHYTRHTLYIVFIIIHVYYTHKVTFEYK